MWLMSMYKCIQNIFRSSFEQILLVVGVVVKATDSRTIHSSGPVVGSNTGPGK